MMKNHPTTRYIDIARKNIFKMDSVYKDHLYARFKGLY